MPITTEVKRITESKPFYALTGVGDYAVEKARAYASTVQVKAESVAKELPEKAREYADAAASRLNKVYDELAVRGRKVVSRVSGEAALELTEVSETAEPAVAAETTTRRTTGASRAKTTASARS
ncbi:hypothetical protein [Microbispora sp. ATCC PTA-5024]|uniref:hypothetical protein n=1 Tax=Microbispora sp. ATCC PTA-5024 TaxID=316330 RepID=UPI0003DB7F79|nr:hypothetical protein [Microbispora sp. ATCC PTA-5024]ETK33049.1 hypothetical protein MPTA5024_26595 [Microbispora sp. ATCC PTA-5024]